MKGVKLEEMENDRVVELENMKVGFLGRRDSMAD